MKTILFEGAFSINSAGDDAALEALKKIVLETCSEEVEFKVLCRHPNDILDRYFGVKSLKNLEYDEKEDSLGRWLRGFNPDDRTIVLDEYIEHFFSADLAILGGGNFINDNSFGLFRGMLSRLCIATFCARIANIPVMLYALSASDLTNPLALRMAQWLFSEASVVVFRDNFSLELLKSLGISFNCSNVMVLPDPVLYCTSASIERIRDICKRENIPISTNKVRLAIALRNFYYADCERHNQLLENVAAIVRNWVSSGGEILFIPQCTYDKGFVYEDDRFVANEVIAMIGDKSNIYAIEGRYWPAEIEGLYSLCDVALCYRLHAGLFACKQNVPCVMIDYEPKVKGFCKAIGMEKYCLPFESDPEFIAKYLKRAIEEFPVKQIVNALSISKDNLRKYGDIVCELLYR